MFQNYIKKEKKKYNNSSSFHYFQNTAEKGFFCIFFPFYLFISPTFKLVIHIYIVRLRIDEDNIWNTRVVLYNLGLPIEKYCSCSNAATFYSNLEHFREKKKTIKEAFGNVGNAPICYKRYILGWFIINNSAGSNQFDHKRVV